MCGRVVCTSHGVALHANEGLPSTTTRVSLLGQSEGGGMGTGGGGCNAALPSDLNETAED